MTQPCLFHLIADGACGRVRRRIVELGLDQPLGFRNVHFESHQTLLKELGGGDVPAVWDGATLHTGEAASLAALERMAAERVG